METTNQALSPIPITPDEEALFRRQGYLLVKGALSGAEVSALKAECERLVTSAHQLGGVVREAYYHHNSYKLAQVLRRTELFDPLIDHPSYFGRLVSLIGPYIQLMGTEVFIRGAAEDATITGFHTDLGPALQRLLPTDDASPFLQIKVQLFLTDLSQPDSSNFALVPGSHRRRVTDSDLLCMIPEVNRAVSPDGALPPEAIQVLASPGDALLFPHSLWHGVARNRSGRTRYSIALRYGQTALRPHERFDFVLTDSRRRLTSRQRRLLGDFGGAGSSPYRPHQQVEVIEGRSDRGGE